MQLFLRLNKIQAPSYLTALSRPAIISTMTDDDQIRSAYVKGSSPAAIARLLGYSVDYVNDVIAASQKSHAPPARPDYSPEALEAVASEALYQMACDVADNPAGYKPAEALSIIREALDRTKGKAAQSVQVEQTLEIKEAVDDYEVARRIAFILQKQEYIQ